MKSPELKRPYPPEIGVYVIVDKCFESGGSSAFESHTDDGRPAEGAQSYEDLIANLQDEIACNDSGDTEFIVWFVPQDPKGQPHLVGYFTTSKSKFTPA